MVQIDVFADPDLSSTTSTELAELDFDQAFSDLVEQMKSISTDELQDQVHRRFRYSLCPACQRKFLANPLGLPREQDGIKLMEATAFDQALASIAARANALDQTGNWPAEDLTDLANAGACAALPRELGGDGIAPIELHARYQQLAAASLSTALVLTRATRRHRFLQQQKTCRCGINSCQGCWIIQSSPQWELRS